MIVFILLSLLLAFLAGTQNEYLTLLTTPAALIIGLTAMSSCLLAGYFRKLRTTVWHDGFASSGLLVWYAYWKPLFDDDAPMFIFFPLYYTLLTSLLTLALVNKAQYFDVESVQYLRHMEKLTRIDIGMLVLFVIVSLLIPRHYALYPMAMTFFLIRHTIVVCQEAIDT